MTEQEQKAFDLMREALEQALRGISAAIFGTDTYKVSSRGDFVSKVEKQIREALTAANAVSAKALITIESSLRFRLECEQQKSADLLDEVRELKGKLFKARQPQAQGEWKHCSPELLNSGVSCRDTPRRPCECEHGGSHDHWIANPQATEPAPKE